MSAAEFLRGIRVKPARGSANEAPARAPGERVARPPLARRRPISPARTAAFEILTRVGEGKGHSDELLHSHLRASLSCGGPEPGDRAGDGCAALADRARRADRFPALTAGAKAGGAGCDCACVWARFNCCIWIAFQRMPR